MTDTLSIRSRAQVDLRAPSLACLPDCRRCGLLSLSYIHLDDWTDLGVGHATICGRHGAAVSLGGRIRHGAADGHAIPAEGHQQRHHGRNFLPEPRDGGHAGAARDPRQRMGLVSRFRCVVRRSCPNTWLWDARIVSGYLFNPSGDELGSADAGSTHAWVEVFVPGAGWISFDPTNRSVGSTNLVPVAVARKIEQVVPVTGSFHGRSADVISMDVAVNVEDA
jgi:hypothetical protein